MNRIVYSALAIFCFVVVSCTNEPLAPDYSQDHIVLNVFNSPMTTAEGDSATDYERELNRLDCFFYVKDKTNEPCVYYHKASVDDTGNATVSFIVNDLVLKEIFPSGALCDVFVIANLPGDPTFEAKTPQTTMEALGECVLSMKDGGYDVVGKPFVMTGSGKVQKNSPAKISLARVASKVSMKVKVPKSIEVEQGEGKVTMLPVLKDDKGNEPLKTSFHYGTSKSYLSGAFPDDPNNYINTDKISYTLSETTDTHFIYTCDVPFYTYARTWEKGSANAAYVTFEMPWVEQGKDIYKTYYYQILVNGTGRKFEPNKHYEMIVTVGVLGSTVESLPKELDEFSYYVLDWTEKTENGTLGSGDRDEDVEIDKYNYLVVPQTYIEMDNVNTVAIRYNASHKIGVKFTGGSKSVPELGTTTTSFDAFYINNRSGAPDAVEIDNITLVNPENENANFKDDNKKGTLTFNYKLGDGVYSPAYVFITIWLDVDGDGDHDTEDEMSQDVTIVMYPAIYIVGEKSANFSVFVNGYYNGYDRLQPSTNGNSGTEVPYLKIIDKSNVEHQVGKAYGYDSNPNQYTHIISVSSFDKDSKFDINGAPYLYYIGDPRVRSPYLLNVPNEDTTTPNTKAEGWIKAVGVDGKARELTYYYPTSTDVDEGAFQVIAPKFRISSKLAGYSHCSIDDLAPAIRCASYQEDGFPAGRWRLPTTAEVLFVIMLQNEKIIQDLFVGNSNYCSATHTINNNNNNVQIWPGIQKGTNDKTTVSVRCVYDEWYWGSKREANPNDKYNGGYEFTWGDREIY